MSDAFFTTLAFVALSESGERTLSFARKPGADTLLAVEEVDESLLKSTEVFHVGSLSLTDEPARSATHHATKIAKAAGAVISYDPNYRASLWPDADVKTAKARMRELLPYVDVMKLSDEETMLLTDQPELEQAAAALNAMGISCVAVTLGKKRRAGLDQQQERDGRLLSAESAGYHRRGRRVLGRVPLKNACAQKTPE